VVLFETVELLSVFFGFFLLGLIGWGCGCCAAAGCAAAGCAGCCCAGFGGRLLALYLLIFSASIRLYSASPSRALSLALCLLFRCAAVCAMVTYIIFIEKIFKNIFK